MLKNYLLTGWRNIARNRSYAAINIVGLSVGIAAFLLIFLFIQYENSFDNFHKDKERIYRLVSVPYTTATKFSPTAGVPLPVAAGLRNEYPHTGKVAAIFRRDGQITIEGDHLQAEKKFNEEGGLFFAEPEFFDIFNFPWLAGDPKTALGEPNKVVLTQETAERYFGNWKVAIGKQVKYENAEVFQVSGILKNIPSNTDFPIKLVVSYKSLKHVDFTDWIGTYGWGYSFVKLEAGINPATFNNYLHDFVRRNKPADHVNEGLALQPLSDMHFNTGFANYSGRVFSRSLMTTLTLVALLLLLIACINFINLTTAQAFKRSREVGVRKVLGSNRRQLIAQFLCETGVITIFSVILAAFIAYISLPAVNGLVNVHITASFTYAQAIFPLIMIVMGVTMVAGIYPALVISGYNPTNALKNKAIAGKPRVISLRKGLVVMQFCIAQVLTISVLVMMSQMNYFHNAPLGFDEKSILNVPVPGDSASQSKMEMVRQELLQQPGISSVSFSTFSPLDNGIWNNKFNFDHNPIKTDFLTYFKWADASYFNTYHLEFVAGRAYAPSDTLREFVVNESLVKKLGLNNPNDILGKEIKFWSDKKAPVVGVVKDFHTNSLQAPIVPVVIGSWKDSYAMMGIKFEPGKSKEVRSSIENIWKRAYPNSVYEYEFLDNKISSYYNEEGMLSKLYQIFAAIAIFISCLGLYGLVSFMTAQRIKELGIRKVLGASVGQLLFLFSREFALLVAIAFVISAPLANYFMQHWLEQFSFRVHTGLGLFLFALLVSVAITLLTVGYKTFRAAIISPVKSLRSE